MANCQICPILEECEQAKKYVELIYHQEFRDCVMVRHLNHEMDLYISIGLNDARGYKPTAASAMVKGVSTNLVLPSE